MADPAALTDCTRPDQLKECKAQPHLMRIPIGDKSGLMPAFGAHKSLVATNQGKGFIAFRAGNLALFQMLDAAGLRDFAADLCRAADSIDQGQGKQ